MTPELLRDIVISPTFALLGPKYASPQAEAMLQAIALQESGLVHRRQVGGPARSWWQFERGGGVVGVLRHNVSADKAREVCHALGYRPEADTVYTAMEHNDILACAFARLLLYTDPSPLPRGEAEAWNYYRRNWRPGKPHEKRWPANWKRATAAVYA